MKKLSALGYTTALMTEFFYDSHKNLAWYRVPILSDKPSAEFIKFKRYHNNYKEDISKGMKNVLNQEVMRMKTVLERALEILDGSSNVESINFYDAHKVLEQNPKLLEKLRSQKKTGKVTAKK